MGKIIGIDLGTSNSAAAVMIGGKPTIIQASGRHLYRRQGIPISGSIYQGWATHCRRASSPSDDFKP